MTHRLIASELIIDYFRAFKNVRIPLASNLTVISGANGCGKSTLLSLVASCSGINKKSFFGSNFQPEFADFFHIDSTEDFKNYRLFIRYKSLNKDNALVKRLSFKDDTASGRGIRIIPRTTKEYSEFETVSESSRAAYDEYSVGGSARVPLPTIYLSLSRLYPLGEKNGKSSVHPLPKGNRISQVDVKEKFKEWYNFIIPNSIKETANISLIKKSACSRMSAHMDMYNIPSLSQSVGQDSVGNIVSALIDIYLLSLKEDYCGAVLCLDEIDVSLHPDSQIRLLELIYELSDSLKIQFVVSSHSLTIIKELLEKERKNPEKFGVVYLKNASAPFQTAVKDYYLLKADLFSQYSYNKTKVRIYFEDEIGQDLFNYLIKAFVAIYGLIKSNNSNCVLRNQPCLELSEKIEKDILACSNIKEIYDDLNQIVTHCGCDELLDISKADAPLFKRIIMMLDGDARLKKDKQPKCCEYIDKDFCLEKGCNEISHTKNIIFAPGYFAPEGFLFRIIKRICKQEVCNTIFWRTIDQSEETFLYSRDKIYQQLNSILPVFCNDDLKKLFKKNEGMLWKFVKSSNIIDFYYSDYNTIPELIDFIKNLKSAYDMTKPITVKNRYF